MEIDRKNFLGIVGVSVCLGIIIAYKMLWLNSHNNSSDEMRTTPTVTQGQFAITSSAFEQNGVIPTMYTCNGENKNPPLAFVHIPAKTQSLALIVEDPDAPIGTFVHWLLWNILPETTEILSGKVPDKSEQGTNSTGRQRYDGPCPPSRHRYYFILYAADSMIGLDGKANKQDLEKALAGHILDKVQLVGYYGN